LADEFFDHQRTNARCGFQQPNPERFTKAQELHLMSGSYAPQKRRFPGTHFSDNQNEPVTPAGRVLQRIGECLLEICAHIEQLALEIGAKRNTTGALLCY
jgi:hypothetical protein